MLVILKWLLISGELGRLEKITPLLLSENLRTSNAQTSGPSPEPIWRQSWLALPGEFWYNELMPANERQVGGNHYGRRKYQHWDMVHEFKLDYF
jgi:hypothetical protein